MPHEINIRPPGEILRVQGSSDDELLFRQPCGRLYEKLCQRLLPVLGVSPEIRKVSSVLSGRQGRAMSFRVHAPVERLGVLRAKRGLEPFQRPPSRVAQDKVEASEPVRRHIRDFAAALKSLERDRSVQVIEAPDSRF